ncbi:urea carboxylase [Caballeronia sp. SL2Y3]|uniref:urea carboxylase n=1 Tax=Caballeronia sp. SL2Y3 TaxID=2878151 RepID=UPI001FD50213|nr:urea carboxylase [Caballeronia sp. SL2Y3]
MFEKILIANRGAIACRILRTLRELNVTGVAVYAEADRASRHVSEAPIAHALGDGPAAVTYLDTAKILEVARREGVQAIHPGYGFLSENAAFGEACEAAGIAFIGPTPAQLRAFGLKHTAREIAASQGVPMLEGTGLLEGVAAALEAAQAIGYPVMLKSTAGGGGIGMRVCWNADELATHFDAVKRLGENNFSDAGVFLEKYIERARHLEVQVFGDGHGDAIALGVRDCSVQRRNQKVLEETPAPCLPEGISDALCDAAVKLAKAVGYRSAGTVEFVYDSAARQFYFLEVNTRLQVEHGVTEQVWGVDLVRWMIELAAGTLAPLKELVAGLTPRGHAIQARLYAEDPGRDFKPSPGLLTDVALPPADGRALRIDTWIEAGCEVPPYFDPMLAKIIAWSPTRDEARHALDAALDETRIYGVETNRDYLRQIVQDTPFASGEPWTRCLEALAYRATTVEVVSGGTQTTVQDHPGRLGYWAVGIPPSGPMDDRAMRLGNRLIGNAADAAALEITMSGPTLRFNTDAVVAITGAQIPVHLNDVEQPLNTSIHVPAGATLALGTIRGAGARAYLCVRGGLDVASYLGSRSTFTLGQFGGHGGRALRAGDVLHLYPLADKHAGAVLPNVPALDSVRTIRVIYGPHGAPEYFTAPYIERFFDTEWEIHFNSSRTGVRLIGPKPEWAREDGGEAGLHPSNIHDNPYAVGAIDFTGDMPVILGPDGPSLGGFVCPVTIIEADLWHIGQLKAGDKVRFVPVDIDAAREAARQRRREIDTLTVEPNALPERSAPLTSPIVLDTGSGHERLVARVSGDTHLLLEIGPAELDLVSRFRGHALMQALEAQALAGVIDLTPGIRSLQVHYRPDDLPLARLLAIVAEAWQQVLLQRDLRVPSRVVHLPLSWDDPACRLAIEKYMTTVRKDAPWCPSNLEFIRRINDLDSIDAVKRIVFDASYLVMGLGDVYLGAPVATPLDPRHRLVTTKYNPARTWTAENSVGIGGAYLCVYGMEGPGGYQFVGRTLQMWNRYRKVADFAGQHFLLRFFDQIRFYEVPADELLRIRADFPLGRYPLRIEQTELSLSDYQAFLAEESASIDAFRSRQQAAFNAERERWREAGATEDALDAPAVEEAPFAALEDGEVAVDSEIAGSLWQVKVATGDIVSAGDVLVVIESMKMEIAVCAPCAGKVGPIHVAPGSPVRAGQRVAVIQRH